VRAPVAAARPRQANGLAAAAAIDPRLCEALLRRSALAGEVLLHDIDGGGSGWHVSCVLAGRGFGRLDYNYTACQW
jgi:hypothetical protein